MCVTAKGAGTLTEATIFIAALDKPIEAERAAYRGVRRRRAARNSMRFATDGGELRVPNRDGAERAASGILCYEFAPLEKKST
jgi:hypothetical protein